MAITDLFIDASATGTGSGDTPANACVKIINNSLMAQAVRAWVRRTHVESGNGGTLGVNVNDNSKNWRGWIIGWPNSGDPFYEIRPAAGISAGWDSDDSALGIKTTFGLNFPTLSASGTNGITAVYGTIIANMNFDQLNGALPTQAAVSLARQSSFFENVSFTCGQGYTSSLQLNFHQAFIGRMWWISSGSQLGRNQNVVIDELLIHSLSSNSGGLLSRGNQGNTERRINHIINYSSSIDFIFENAGINEAFDTDRPYPCVIGRITGVKPYSGAFNPTVNGDAFDEAYRIDDYFGEGPIIGSKFGPKVRLANSAEAMYDNGRALYIQVQSWDRFSENKIGGHAMHTIPARKYFDVVSGTPITIYQPFYVDSTAVWSLSQGEMKFRLRALGCGGTIITSAHILPGSLANWGGSKLGGGAAWHAVNTFTPEETGQVPFECFLPVQTRSNDTSGNTYILWGEPWAVQ